MKRIFVIGAVGEMCIEATKDLIATSGYGEFMLADIDEAKLNKLKKELDADHTPKPHPGKRSTGF